MATSNIQKIRSGVEKSPGARAIKANRIAKRFFFLFLTVSFAAVALMLLRLDIPLLDVPGRAFSR